MNSFNFNIELPDYSSIEHYITIRGGVYRPYMGSHSPIYGLQFSIDL